MSFIIISKHTINYGNYCYDRSHGIFKLKEHENVFDGFERWLKT